MTKTFNSIQTYLYSIFNNGNCQREASQNSGYETVFLNRNGSSFAVILAHECHASIKGCVNLCKPVCSKLAYGIV